MYENKHQPLASKKVYYHRLRYHATLTALILATCLLIGTAGFYYTCRPNVVLIDAFHNASMLLSGMGPVLDASKMSNGAKIFSSLYALFSGVTFISSIGILLTPTIHRFFHKLHLEK
jgi:hypothetical protein